MKKLLTLFAVMILAGSMHAHAQTQPAKSALPPPPAEKVVKAEDPLPESPASVKEGDSDIKIIEGRKVRVDNQGVQSLEVVTPTLAPKPKTENSVK